MLIELVTVLFWKTVADQVPQRPWHYQVMPAHARFAMKHTDNKMCPRLKVM
jgi:hypothetical protein